MKRLIDADEMKMSKCPAVVNEYTKGWNDAIDAIIENAPTIDAESHWIPCSEALPENSDTVLITHRGGVSVGWYNGRYWERGASTKHRELTTVVAWVPLPKPDEGETE